MKSTTNDNKGDSVRRGRSARRKTSSDFELTTYLQEGYDSIIYAVEFCHHLKDGEPIIFATCGGNFIRIYQCRNDRRIDLLHCYGDPSESEDYYTCCWSYDPNTSTPILIAAGFNRIIRMIHFTATSYGMCILGGHCDAINDLKIHPTNPSLLLSASKDCSIILWNIQTDVCIVVFKAIQTLAIEVVSIDFDAVGNRIATCGTDKSLRIWSLNKPSIQEAITASATHTRSENRRVFKTVMEFFPEHTANDIHNRVVDCVKWMGDFILAKSVDDSVVCLQPGPSEDDTIGSNSAASVIHTFNYVGGENCFMRFSMDISKTYMALGNGSGTTFVWKIDADELTEATQLTHRFCTSTVRATAFSRDSKILISVCDDGTVWKWDRVDTV